MKIFENHRVTWDRRNATGAKNAQGHRTVASAVGYPKLNTPCNVQERSSVSVQTPSGLRTILRRTVYSITFMDGRIGDIVTIDGNEYTVTDVHKEPTVIGDQTAYAQYACERGSS